MAETFWGEDEMMLPVEEEELPVFGRNIFDSEELTFEPSMNLATPKNYVLGAGDEVIIDIWGDNAATIREEISPDGTINIESLGLVNLSSTPKSTSPFKLHPFTTSHSISGSSAKPASTSSKATSSPGRRRCCEP